MEGVFLSVIDGRCLSFDAHQACMLSNQSNNEEEFVLAHFRPYSSRPLLIENIGLTKPDLVIVI